MSYFLSSPSFHVSIETNEDNSFKVVVYSLLMKYSYKTFYCC